MAKRGENIYRRKDGRWEARYIKGYKNGKAFYGYIYASTYTEAKIKKALIIATPEQVQTPTTTCLTSFATLSKIWLKNIRITVKESTYARYYRIVEVYLLPILGSYRLDKIEATYLNNIPALLMKEGGIYRKELSPKTVCDILSVLKAILRFGKDNNYPICDTKSLKYPIRKPKLTSIISKENISKLEQQLQQSKDKVSLGIIFTLFTGIRIGELCGLRWGDIDFTSGTVTIQRTVERIPEVDPLALKRTKIILSEPKTASSMRIIPLPKYLLSYIKAYKRPADCYLLTGTSKYMEPHQFYILYKRYLQQLGMEGYTFHALRHTFATRCVELGFDPKSLAEILGHASVLTTLSVYVHPTLQQKQQQMNRLTSVF